MWRKVFSSNQPKPKNEFSGIKVIVWWQIKHVRRHGGESSQRWKFTLHVRWYVQLVLYYTISQSQVLKTSVKKYRVILTYKSTTLFRYLGVHECILITRPSVSSICLFVNNFTCYCYVHFKTFFFKFIKSIILSNKTFNLAPKIMYLYKI